MGTAVAPFDCIVIGAGSGGMTVAIGLGRIGKRVALIEKGELGGDCTNYGCIPSKTLIHLSRQSERSPNPFKKIKQIIDSIHEEEQHSIAELSTVEYIRGTAQFLDQKTISVELNSGKKRVLTAQKIVIATGSSPQVIPVPGAPAEIVHTNESIFYLSKLPKKMVVIGSGVVACELALAFADLGVQVVLLNRGTTLLKEQLPVVQVVLTSVFKHKKIQTIWQASEYTYENGAVLYEQEGKKHTVESVDIILQAVGRKPNTENLQLEKAGVEYQKSGITIDQNCRTTTSSIFAIGDVTTRGGLTHIANAQGRQVVQQIAFPFLPVASLGTVAQAVFTTPQLAVTGCDALTAQALLEKGVVKRYSVALAKTDRGITDGVEEGFITVFAYRLTGKIAHVSIVAESAGEMIPLFSLAIDQNITLWKLQNLIFPYPTLIQAARQIADLFVFGTLRDLRVEVSAVVSIWAREFFTKHWQKLVAVVAWSCIVTAAQWYLYDTGQSAGMLLTSLVQTLQQAWYGPLLYGLIYFIRPLILFPASILTALAGAVWGVRLGVAYAITAATLSSLIPYCVGRWFGKNHPTLPGPLTAFEKVVSKNSFESTLSVRLLYVPFDIGSFILGFFQVPLLPYLAATVLGSIFGTLTFVSVGATIDLEKLSMGMFDIKSEILLQSIVLAVGGIVVSRILKYLIAQYHARSKNLR